MIVLPLRLPLSQLQAFSSLSCNIRVYSQPLFSPVEAAHYTASGDAVNPPLHHLIGLLTVLCLTWATPGYAPNIYWHVWTIDASGNGADGVHTGDINRDGLVDVVSGWEQSGDLMLYLNPGPAAVRDAAAWSAVDISGGVTIEGIEDAAFADLDLDGFDDAVISSIEGHTQSLGIHWLEGANIEAAADWRAFNLVPARLAGYMKARVAQIDGVAGADIVAGSKSMDGAAAGIYWFKAPVGTHPDNVGQWQRFYIGPVDYKTVTLVIKDMDADSLLDVVVSGRNGVAWFRNPGREALGDVPAQAQWERIVIAKAGSEFTFCDHVIDGMEDMIVATSHDSGMVAKWLKRLDASGRAWEQYPITSSSLRREDSYSRKFVLKGVSCGYVDGDDLIDIVFTGSGDGHGVFMMSPRTNIARGLSWNLTNLTPYADHMKYDNLRLVDMDADGDLDVLTTEEGEGIFTAGDGVLWLENPLPAKRNPLPVLAATEDAARSR
tara:strand:- start:1985 stop:3460 length:1476 start_codon:yes stop_codon:yes gene_type:complete